MRISIVTDEISSDVETAIELAHSWGVSDLELRGVGSERVPFISPYEVERLGELLEEYSCHIVAISPGLFKIPLPSERHEKFPVKAIDFTLYQEWQDAHDLALYHLQEMLPASVQFANDFNVKLIVIFGFHRGTTSSKAPVPDEVLNYLQLAAEAISGTDIKLALEVEGGFWADTGQRTAEIIRDVDSPALGINWDPGNSIVTGEKTYPDGYAAVRDLVFHVHFKDVVRQLDGSFQYATHGEIDWESQIRALTQDNYSGYISVETHMRPKIRMAKAALDRLTAIIALASE